MPFSQTGTKTIFGWSALILLCFLSQTAHAQQCNELCFNLTNSEQPKSNETTQPANDEIYQRCHIICEKFRSNNTACRLVSIHEMLRSTVNVSKLCSKENLMTECQPCVTGGFYSHPNDQGRYYQCVYGVLLPKYCQSGTIWYQHTRTCIFDFLSRWKNKLNIRRDGLDVQPTQVQSASETMCVFGVYNPKCKPCENDSYHSKTASLTHFYHCKNGWLYLMYCPSGTIWNSTLSACVYGASSLCLYGNDDTDCLPCLQDTYYSKPGSVRQFYQCVHGWLFVRSCPTGTVWAGLLKECVAGSVPGIWNTAEGIPDISDLPEHVPDVTNIPSGVRDESSPSKGLHSREPIDPTRTNFCIFGVNQPRCRRCAPGTFYPKLKSTIEFYQCLSGWLFIMECPLNTVWDGESTKCIYDELASALRGINAKPENQTGEGGNGRETAIGGSQGTGGATGGNQGTGGATGGSQGAGGATGGSQGVGGATGGSQGTGGVTGGSQGTGGATGGTPGTGDQTGGNQGTGGVTGGSQGTGGTDGSQGTGSVTGGGVAGGKQRPGSGGGTSSGGGAGGGGGGGSGGSGGGGGQVTGKGTAGSVGTGEVTNGTGNRRMSTLKPPIDLTRGGTTTEPSSRKNNGFIPVTPSIPSLLGILTNRETIDVNTTQFCVFGVKNPQCRPCIKYTYYSKLGSNKQFYHCNYGVLYVLECPTQTVWNRRLGSCVYESNPLWSQNLLERPGQLNRTNGGFQLPAGANGLLANVNGTFVPVTSNLPKMKAVNPNETTLCISEIDNPQCTPCIKDYFYPKLNSLIQFYQCRIGLLVLLQCPVNTIWDGRSIRCLYDMMRITFDPVLNIFPEDFGSTDTNKPIRWRTDLSIESRTDNESEKVWPTRVPVNPMTTNLCIYEVNNTECEACEKGSYYPKAESIAEFYQCSHGILFLMQCPESTIWHGESLRCIYEEGDTFNYTNFYNESHGMDAINPNATSLCIFEANITDCEPCQQGGYYPIIGSLSEFFQCSHGQLVPMKCPARTIWNNKIIRCVYDRSQVWLLTDTETGVENADEIARRTEMNIEYPEREPINPNTTNLCIFKVNNTRCYPCQKGSYYPKYQSEAHFYQCSQGLLFLMNCPDNTIWHGKSIRCIYDQTRLWRLAAIEIKKDAALANDIPLQFLTPRWPQIPAGHVDLSKMCLFDHYEAGCQHCTVGITYSHPFRQDLYYKCVEGVLQPKLCPDGMWWHQMAAQCVHKGVYNMTFSQRPISIYEPIDPTTTPLCVFDTNNTRCIPCQPNSYYPKFKSISQFYQCSHGLLFLMQCPDKTVWNEASIKCVYGPERYWFAFVVKTIQQSKIPGSLREILHITNSSSRTKIA
ncbi:uncharacterized protein LOC118763360 isoform X50 [Octopus sinensis]|uniref:Uncharacterized protein LOC118763360 isoform X50 n=1 Tax=Octopus sinensis TaxID=2607531 RepID=A0A7E6EVE1_9MOLL|nr:uncharacterized protein LOC118763360 isoform X50 [Octopus sinensis]